MILTFARDQPAQLQQLFRRLADEIKVLKAAIRLGVSAFSKAAQKQRSPSRNTPLFNRLTFPLNQPQTGPLFLRLDFDDYFCGVTQSCANELRQGVGVSHRRAKQASPSLFRQVSEDSCENFLEA